MDETKSRVIQVVTEDGQEPYILKLIRRNKLLKKYARRCFREKQAVKETVNSSILTSFLLIVIAIQGLIIWSLY